MFDESSNDDEIAGDDRRADGSVKFFYSFSSDGVQTSPLLLDTKHISRNDSLTCLDSPSALGHPPERSEEGDSLGILYAFGKASPANDEIIPPQSCCGFGSRLGCSLRQKDVSCCSLLEKGGWEGGTMSSQTSLDFCTTGQSVSPIINKEDERVLCRADVQKPREERELVSDSQSSRLVGSAVEEPSRLPSVVVKGGSAEEPDVSCSVVEEQHGDTYCALSEIGGRSGRSRVRHTIGPVSGRDLRLELKGLVDGSGASLPPVPNNPLRIGTPRDPMTPRQHLYHPQLATSSPSRNGVPSLSRSSRSRLAPSVSRNVKKDDWSGDDGGAASGHCMQMKRRGVSLTSPIQMANEFQYAGPRVSLLSGLQALALDATPSPSWHPFDPMDGSSSFSETPPPPPKSPSPPVHSAMKMASTKVCCDVEAASPVRLFVGRIPKSFRSDDLRKLFKPFGPVLESNIIRDRHSSQSRGCGFVRLRDLDHARRAIASLNQSVHLDPSSGPIQVKFATGELERLNLPINLQPGGECVKVFFGNLAASTTESELIDLFRVFGDFEELCILRDRNQRSKCSGFVTFRSLLSAQASISALNGKHRVAKSLRPMEVRIARSRNQRQAAAASSDDYSGGGGEGGCIPSIPSFPFT